MYFQVKPGVSISDVLKDIKSILRRVDKLNDHGFSGDGNFASNVQQLEKQASVLQVDEAKDGMDDAVAAGTMRSAIELLRKLYNALLVFKKLEPFFKTHVFVKFPTPTPEKCRRVLDLIHTDMTDYYFRYNTGQVEDDKPIIRYLCSHLSVSCEDLDSNTITLAHLRRIQSDSEKEETVIYRIASGLEVARSRPEDVQNSTFATRTPENPVEAESSSSQPSFVPLIFHQKRSARGGGRGNADHPSRLRHLQVVRYELKDLENALMQSPLTKKPDAIFLAHVIHLLTCGKLDKPASLVDYIQSLKDSNNYHMPTLSFIINTQGDLSGDMEIELTPDSENLNATIKSIITTLRDESSRIRQLLDHKLPAAAASLAPTRS